MRFIHLYLIGYFVLVIGAGLALWQAGVLQRISAIWILIGSLIVIGLASCSPSRRSDPQRSREKGRTGRRGWKGKP
jgi:hypothetical protein